MDTQRLVRRPQDGRDLPVGQGQQGGIDLLADEAGQGPVGDERGDGQDERDAHEMPQRQTGLEVEMHQGAGPNR